MGPDQPDFDFDHSLWRFLQEVSLSVSPFGLSSWEQLSSDEFWHSTPFTGALGAWEQGLESRLVTADGRSAIRTRSLGLYIYIILYTVYTICKVAASQNIRSGSSSGINSHHLPRFWKSLTGSLSSSSSTTSFVWSSSSSNRILQNWFNMHSSSTFGCINSSNRILTNRCKMHSSSNLVRTNSSNRIPANCCKMHPPHPTLSHND